ncbi:phosphonate C-P lyase system protein PhnH [Thioclava sp. BHET1]|nr:phosphonate C-P lyase system protein PhnH [Thioclava sp. BHET1]
METQSLRGGFSTPSEQSARAFRAIMDAMARPGTVQRPEGAEPPAPMSSAAGAVLLVLCDRTTPVHLAGDWDRPELRDWITFQTGAPLVGPEAADFAFGDWDSLLPLDRFAEGTPEYPDRSTTLIIERPALAPATHRLRGPGIRETAEIALPEGVEAARGANRFPLGRDLILCCGPELCALPRSTRLEAL